MRNLSRFLPLLLVVACDTAAWCQPLRIVVAPIINTAPCKFAGPDLERTTGIMEAVAMEYLDKAATASDLILVNEAYVRAALEDTKLDFNKSGDRKPERLQALGKALQADRVVVCLVEWTDQKNPEAAANALNPNLSKSISKVRVRLWVQDIAANRLIVDGTKTTYSGEAKGGFFGTVNPRDMSGDPTGKSAIIENEYRKRATYLGKALVDAFRQSLGPVLGLKDPDRL